MIKLTDDTQTQNSVEQATTLSNHTAHTYFTHLQCMFKSVPLKNLGNFVDVGQLAVT